MALVTAGSTPSLPPLPIDEHLAAVRTAVRVHRAAVVTAAPGAGKTTRVPPALAEDGSVLLLQPRRVAARSIARRIAGERGWTVGREVGWHVRGDRHYTAETRVVVATEGILTATLQQDPLAARFRTIVIDEFHERSIHADVGLALAREAWKARDDLWLVVMSATLDASRVAAYLGGCPVIDAPGRRHVLDISFHAGVGIADAARALLGAGGAVLCFLPGAPEIRRAASELSRVVPGVPVLPLHGGLEADAQDAALRASDAPRIILATNLAETTVTVPDVTAVVDTGLHKVARYDADRAIDSLTLERISQDSADQRAGRAGRVQAGRAWRLWDARDRLRPHREPEISRVDLAATVLDIAAWGGDAGRIDWFDAPPPGALASAVALLRRLGALDTRGGLTALGSRLARLPLHPRLSRILIEGGGDRALARACALLSERQTFVARQGATSCDLLSAVDRDAALPAHVLDAARDIEQRAREAAGLTRGDRNALPDQEFRRAILAGYPDRVARRRAPASDRFQLASGAGARLARESGVVNHELIVAVDVTAGTAPGTDALIRMATGLEPDWIQPTATDVVHEYDAIRREVRADRVAWYEALVLSRHAVRPDPAVSGSLLAEALRAQGPRRGDRALLDRLAFAGVQTTFEQLVARAAEGRLRLDDVDLADALAGSDRQALDRYAPDRLRVPSGRDVSLEYREGQVFAAVKLQELFGLADSPRVGRAEVPVTFELLSPAGRPVQVTRDLRSFWDRGYQEVRRELRARYPRHPWPDDPWTALPTRRALPRKPH
jgi:ATP-dependent helicase HrpB